MPLRLEVKYNGAVPSDVEVEIGETAMEGLGKKSGKLGYVQKIDGDTLRIKSIFTQEKRVPDVWRYVLRNTGRYLSLREHSGAIKAVCREKNNYRDKPAENSDELGITIALLLESPHKDEFDSNDSPIAPAQGTTGTNIHEYFEHIINIEIGRFNFVTQEAGLIICNPIPFQTSLHMIHSGILKCKDKLKEDIWKALWEETCVREDFRSRIKNYKPDLVINACTGGSKEGSLNDKVTCYLKSTEICENICRINHPSSWNIPKLQSA
ncbi:MAG: hypothetical protein OXF79_27580 [Chloroflexi bacterium]|nr:hypothetical protein [Chloroflexota bacterium]